MIGKHDAKKGLIFFPPDKKILNAVRKAPANQPNKPRSVKEAISYQLHLCAFLLAAAAAPADPAPAATGDPIPFVNPFFMLSGALLTDSFDGPQLDTNL